MRDFPACDRKRSRLPRKGVAVIVALGLLAITLTISYTLLRTQSTSRLIQANVSRTNQARQAALAGLQVALKKIHDPQWQGVAVPLSGNVSATDSFVVTFVTGDSELTASHVDYQEYPYRLTLRSVGTSIDPTDINRRAEHTLEVVVQLVRERMAAEPAAWSGVQGNTVTQWGNASAEINPPCRIEGPSRFNGTLSFAPSVPPTVRPFDGRIDEVAIVADELSAAELLAIYNGTAHYSTHWGNLKAWWRLNDAAGATTAANVMGSVGALYEGAEPGSDASPFGGTGSARFDGEVDGITLGSVDCPGIEMTIMAWIKADDFGTSEARIISKSNGVEEDDHWWMLGTAKHGNSHRLRFRLKSTLGSTKTLSASSGNLPTGQWVFAAATFNGLNMKLYLNGEQVGSMFHLGGVATNAWVPAWIGENAPGSSRGLYFRHLNRMSAAGIADLRPFDGPLTVRSATLDTADRSLISDELGVPLIDDPAATAANYSSYRPPAASTYRLYPGGAEYTIATLSSRVSNQQLEPDMLTNPLGVFQATKDVELQSNVKVRGVLLGAKDIDLNGTNIRIEAVDLPPLVGSTQRIQLPTLLAGRRLEFRSDSTVTADGMMVVVDRTRFASDDSAMTASLTGRLVTGNLVIEPRSPWASYTSSKWDTLALAFELQRRSADGIPYYPAWLDSQGLSSNPHFKIVPPSDNIHFHWHDWTQPLYLPESDGDGLRWDIVRWNDQG